MEPPSPEQTSGEPIEQPNRYYQSQAERLLNRHTRDFIEFTRSNEEFVVIGDELIRTCESTGYNILLRHNDMPFTSKKPLIFYSNYIGRPRHFGLLLSEMEDEAIITPEQVRFGVKASKVLYGGWRIDEENERIVDFQRIDAEGNISQDQVDETVETVITFSPKEPNQAARIADFLITHASSTQPGAIEDSFEIPDIRATAVLRNVLRSPVFEEVIGNILNAGQVRLITARRRTRFPKSWRSVPFELHEQLATYLASRGVLP